MRVSRRVVALVLVISAVACTSPSKKSGGSEASPTTVVVPGTMPANGSATTSPLSPVPLGTKIATPVGNEVTVYDYVSPVPSGKLFEDAAAGNVYSAVNVEVCAGAAGMMGGNSVKPTLFQLVMPDNARIAATVGIKQPTLLAIELPAGACVRGWVTYEQPIGRPTSVDYQGPPAYRWAL